MTNRTFVCKGAGIGTDPVSISVTFDNSEIFNGIVPTFTDRPVGNSIPEVFTWQLDINDCNWERPLSIAVTGGEFLVCKIESNYLSGYNPEIQDNTSLEDLQTMFVAESLEFGTFNNSIDFVEGVGNVVYSDAKLDVKINGITHVKTDSASRPGEWSWLITDQGELEFTVKCNLLPTNPILLT